jgi:hypothetical protein
MPIQSIYLLGALAGISGQPVRGTDPDDVSALDRNGAALYDPVSLIFRHRGQVTVQPEGIDLWRQSHFRSLFWLLRLFGYPVNFRALFPSGLCGSPIVAGMLR